MGEVSLRGCLRSFWDLLRLAPWAILLPSFHTEWLGWLLAFLVELLLWAVLWVLFWQAFYRAKTRKSAVHFVTTSDGWRLALSHYPQQGAPRGRFPVLLCHGLGANRFSFDLGCQPSLPVHLSQAGFDVWSLALRGHGRSDRPRLGSHQRFGWSFDDYLHIDLPAAIAHVCALTSTDWRKSHTCWKAVSLMISSETMGTIFAVRSTRIPQVHLIGHSMGGMLCLCYCGTATAVRSVTAIAASLDLWRSNSDFVRLRRGSWLARLLPAVPLGVLARMVAPWTGRRQNRFEEFSLWSANVDSDLIRRHYANTFQAISSPVLLQLSTAFDEGGLRSLSGAENYSVLAAGSHVPTLFLAADRDRQCPVDACRRTCARLAQESPVHRLVVFGKETGQPEHYAHFDLLLGKRAATEVFPVIEHWLQQHDEDAAGEHHI